MQLSAGKFSSLRRLADAAGRFKMIAADQRPPIFNVIREKTGAGDIDHGEVAAFKALLTQELASLGTAILLDPVWGYASCIPHIRPGQGVLVTDEDHAFEETPDGRLSREIADWDVAKIKRLGADGVKLLVWYRPDAAARIRRHQEDLVERVGRDCARHDLTFLLELLVYPLRGEDGQTADYVEHAAKRPERVIESLKVFTDPRFNVDIFKLESPVAAQDVASPDAPEAARVQSWFDEMGRIATRPWVMLSAGADMETFRNVLHYAYRAGASGYLAGRAIWHPATRHYPDEAAFRQALRDEAVPYMHALNALTDDLARPWFDHSAFGGALPDIAGSGPDFHRRYPAA